MKIYTKTGDKGETRLLGDKRVSKDDPVVEALGAIDELNAMLGTLNLPELGKIQKDLMGMAAVIAGRQGDKGQKIWDKRLDNRVGELEEDMDKMQGKLPRLHNFILPQGPIHLARAICRRTERRVISAKNYKLKTSNSVVRYLNRLSDYLFVLARRENAKKGLEETAWPGRF